MKIPPRLSSLLQKDNLLDAAVHHVLSVVRPWFEDNKLVFFPEYTDHGPKHIQEVFETAESLITKRAWTVLRPEDAASLILGIILHDCAMHLSEDGFITLINDDSRSHNNDFSDKPWPQLWNEFMAEARRFDERKLKALFDNTEPICSPALDSLKMDRQDRLLIGEFLRRHHPRLAHEIALTGVPGPPSKGLSLGNLPQNIKELAGVIARSHGLDLRVCVDHLNYKSKWGARRTTGVHVTYLMVLVRIADYLQIHSTRAPQEVLQVRSLRSPVSRGEWDAHAAIKDIHQETDDPEAIWVEAAPENVQTYLKLKHLLTDIQRELDESWAVIGEVYGPKEELRGLGIKLRRIKSNLYNPASFAEKVSYIPCHAALQTAGVDLLKLLIRPLYGDNPGIGIRELLQNSVDACVELKDYLSKRPGLPQPVLQDQSSDVIIALEEKEDRTKWIRVSDRGIGMTVDTVLNYFLKAGASFRNSHAWREQHEDKHGQTSVLRSGRFGIGILAGFLLGNEIHVSTRHVTAQPNEGVSFICRLEDETIQLNRANRPVGTEVSIPISESVFLRLMGHGYEEIDGPIAWNWYSLTDPSVHRLTPEGQLKQVHNLPPVDSHLPPEWRRIRHPDYRDIHWSFSEDVRQLTCNGITVANLDRFDVDEENSVRGRFWVRGLNCPKLSVFDPNGYLPLNLQRTGLSVERLPFEDELLKDLCYDILAFLIVRTPAKRPSLGSLKKRHPKLSARYLHHPGIKLDFWHYFSQEGMTLLDSWNMKQLHLSKVNAISSLSLLRVFGDQPFQPHLPAFSYHDVPRVIKSVLRIGWLNAQGYRAILHKTLIDVLYKQDRFLQRRSIFSRFKEWENDTWILVKQGECPPLELNLDELPSEDDAHQFDFITVAYTLKAANKSNPLAEAWREVIGLPYIPYDITQRRKQLGNAYNRLASYIRAWEEVERQERGYSEN